MKLSLTTFRLHAMRLREFGAVRVAYRKGETEYVVEFEGSPDREATDAHGGGIGFRVDDEEENDE